MNTILMFAHILIFIISICLFVFRYIINNNFFYLNYMFYLLFFSLFYISLPSIVTMATGFSLVNASHSTLQSTALIGLYFVTIFLIGYLFSSNINFNLNSIKLSYTKDLNLILIILLSLIFIYICAIILLNLNNIISLYGDRAAQSFFNENLENIYKIKPLFIIQIALTTYLFLQMKKKKLILFLFPYIIYDFLLSGRTYLFSLFILFFIFNILQSNIIKIKYIFILIMLILSISVLRANLNEFQLENLLQIFFEFTQTWETTQLVYETTQQQDFVSSIIYSFMRIFPSIVYEVFFGTYDSYTNIIEKNNPLSWGIAGSLVAEALVYKDNMITIIFPFMVILYGNFINFLLKTNYSTGVIIFILSIIYLQQIFRYSFLEIAMYPIYVIFFLLPFILIIDLVKAIAYKNNIWRNNV